MRVVLDKILKEKNKSLYWLAENIGIAYPNLHKLMRNKTALIKFETLEKICIALECTPNDILIVENHSE